MATKRSALARAVRPLVKSSGLRYGALESRGVSSILLGVAAIVLASGASSALKKTSTALPETLREARAFWLSVRAPQGELRS